MRCSVGASVSLRRMPQAGRSGCRIGGCALTSGEAAPTVTDVFIARASTAVAKRPPPAGWHAWEKCWPRSGDGGAPRSSRNLQLRRAACARVWPQRESRHQRGLPSVAAPLPCRQVVVAAAAAAAATVIRSRGTCGALRWPAAPALAAHSHAAPLPFAEQPQVRPPPNRRCGRPPGMDPSVKPQVLQANNILMCGMRLSGK